MWWTNNKTRWDIYVICWPYFGAVTLCCHCCIVENILNVRMKFTMYETRQKYKVAISFICSFMAAWYLEPFDTEIDTTCFIRLYGWIMLLNPLVFFYLQRKTCEVRDVPFMGNWARLTKLSAALVSDATHRLTPLNKALYITVPHWHLNNAHMKGDVNLAWELILFLFGSFTSLHRVTIYT